ncbi:MAG: tRNA (guanosine(37)-N1)-methyltransferase TrmD [Nocardioidaceae bacterium]
MRIDVVTIFPDYLAPLRLSLLGKARATGLVEVRVHDLRAWTSDRHHSVDDTPYGGGAGMVMKPEPWGAALDAIIAGTESDIAETGTPGSAVAGARAGEPERGPCLIVPTPAGYRFTQATAERLAAEPWLVFASGRYEGIDQRVVDHYAERLDVREISIGDYVVNGGDVAAMVIIEAVVRLVPGFVGNSASLDEESHGTGAGGLLEYPVYTKPAVWRGREVPSVLVSGHHAEIGRWRRDEMLRRTASRRPDLLAGTSDGQGSETG